MLVKIKLSDGGFLYRNVTRTNIRKVAKSIHQQFPTTNYPSLEGTIFNAYQKELTVITLNPPVAQVVEK